MILLVAYLCVYGGERKMERGKIENLWKNA